MRNDPLKYAIVLALSLLFGSAETLAIVTTPSMPGRSAALGSVTTTSGRIDTGDTAIHLIPFERSREDRVRVTTLAPDADLDLQLLAPSGRALDRDTSEGRVAEVATVPSSTGRYAVGGCAVGTRPRPHQTDARPALPRSALQQHPNSRAARRAPRASPVPRAATTRRDPEVLQRRRSLVTSDGHRYARADLRLQP